MAGGARPASRSGRRAASPPRARTRRAGQGDSRHILYQSLDKLRIVDIETGETRTVPLDLKWTPAVPTTRVVVHAGKLARHEGADAATNVDVIIDGNRITSVVPHADAQSHQAQVVDASNLTVMPGLTEFHSHLQKDFGERRAARGWRSASRRSAVPAIRPTRRSRIARPTRPACVPARASTAPAT